MPSCILTPPYNDTKGTLLISCMNCVHELLMKIVTTLLTLMLIGLEAFQRFSGGTITVSGINCTTQNYNTINIKFYICSWMVWISTNDIRFNIFKQILLKIKQLRTQMSMNSINITPISLLDIKKLSINHGIHTLDVIHNLKLLSETHSQVKKLNLFHLKQLYILWIGFGLIHIVVPKHQFTSKSVYFYNIRISCLFSF